MKILLDAMGGDKAPAANIRGAVKFLKDSDSEIILIGKEDLLRETFKAEFPNDYKELLNKIKIINAEEVIEMEDIPTVAIKKKTDSSMVKGFQMLKNDEVDVFVSAGNSGALLTGATLLIGRIKGINRPALLATLPSTRGPISVFDTGANTNCREINFIQFAQMGSIYLSEIGVENPKVGLINIGTEDNKGNDLYKSVYKNLKENHEKYKINFIGNVEGRDIMSGNTDVDLVVCDGFTGNIVVKTIEGAARFFKETLTKALMKTTFDKLKLLPIKKGLNSLKEYTDYKVYGGGIFLGVKKNVVKAHGNSDERSFYFTLKQAEQYAKHKVLSRIEDEIATVADLGIDKE